MTEALKAAQVVEVSETQVLILYSNEQLNKTPNFPHYLRCR